MTKTGRPLGEASRAVLSAVEAEPMSARTLAQRLQMSQAYADKVAWNLTAAGYLEIVGKEERMGRRPVAVYGKFNWTRQW